LGEYRDAVFAADLLGGTRIVVERSVLAQSCVLVDLVFSMTIFGVVFVTAIFQHR
jgi:hypothetical protein